LKNDSLSQTAQEQRRSRPPFARTYALTHLASQNSAPCCFEKCLLVLIPSKKYRRTFWKEEKQRSILGDFTSLNRLKAQFVSTKHPEMDVFHISHFIPSKKYRRTFWKEEKLRSALGDFTSLNRLKA
jgi:hypothetical protein